MPARVTGRLLECDEPYELFDGQTAELSTLQLGAELEIPVGSAQDDLLLKSGQQFVASDANGCAWSSGGRGADRPAFSLEERFSESTTDLTTTSTRLREIPLPAGPEGAPD